MRIFSIFLAAVQILVVRAHNLLLLTADLPSLPNLPGHPSDWEHIKAKLAVIPITSGYIPSYPKLGLRIENSNSVYHI